MAFGLWEIESKRIMTVSDEVFDWFQDFLDKDANYTFYMGSEEMREELLNSAKVDIKEEKLQNEIIAVLEKMQLDKEYAFGGLRHQEG